MNQPVAMPGRLQAAACPLLAAVLPVRYAIGPIAPQNPASLDAAKLGLPALKGLFPELGPDHPQLHDHPMGYVPRMLRDGWLYLWDEALNELSEYEVSGSLLTSSGRGGGLKDGTSRAYLILAAGSPVRLCWSPCQWSAEIFGMVEQQPALRQRLMREIVPGVAPFSGPVQSLHPQSGDMRPENFRWSCAPEPRYWLLQDPPLKQMQRCEQQHFAVLDDPWGVLFDIAGLMRARARAFESLHRHRMEDWSIAAIVRSMGNSDEKIRGRLASIIDLPHMQSILEEQTRETQSLEADHLRLADLWSNWFATLGESAPHSLESACEHFDITQPAARELLEASFAAAFTGPAATSPGVKAIEHALDPAQVKGQPWLLWSVLGLTQRLDTAHLQRLLQVPDALPTVTDDLARVGAATTRAAAFAAALNLGAANLGKFHLAGGGEPLFAAVAPVLGGRLRSLPEEIHRLTYSLMIAMLARSRQLMEAESLSPADALRWMTAQIGTAHNKGQRRSLERRIEAHERQQRRADRARGPGKPARSPLASQIKAGIPHLRVVPNPDAPPVRNFTQPGYGRAMPELKPRPAMAPAPALPPLSSQQAGLELPRNIKDLLNDAPLKTLIAMVSVWNLGQAGAYAMENRSTMGAMNAGSAFLTTVTASSALFQHWADAEWVQHVAHAGNTNPEARRLLANALGFGAATMLFQAITAGMDIFFFGWRALTAYRTGDLDSAAVHAGLAGASLTYARLSLEAMRALRIARTAVLAGEAQALATGLRVLSLPLRLSLVGLAITIVAGLVTLFFTEDKPLEQWLKQTRFGTRPAEWSRSLSGTLTALYQIVLPVQLSLERWQDINPRTGRMIREVRLILHLPGQQEYRQGMISFDGEEEWKQKADLFRSTGRCVPLVWDESDPIPFDPDTGGRVVRQPAGLTLRRAYHDEGYSRLAAIRGRLTYQPIEGLILPPIDVELS